MTDQVREKAVHAADTLTDFIGDFVGGTALLTRPALKSVEFYKRFNQIGDRGQSTNLDRLDVGI